MGKTIKLFCQVIVRFCSITLPPMANSSLEMTRSRVFPSLLFDYVGQRRHQTLSQEPTQWNFVFWYDETCSQPAKISLRVQRAGWGKHEARVFRILALRHTPNNKGKWIVCKSPFSGHTRAARSVVEGSQSFQGPVGNQTGFKLELNSSGPQPIFRGIHWK